MKDYFAEDKQALEELRSKLISDIKEILTEKELERGMAIGKGTRFLIVGEELRVNGKLIDRLSTDELLSAVESAAVSTVVERREHPKAN